MGQNLVSIFLGTVYISAVYIYDLDNIEIVWKFKDFLTTSEGEAK